MNNYILIFPPLWNLEAPHLALPLLSSQLKKNNFNTQLFDFNIDFFHYIYQEMIIRKNLDFIAKNKKELLKNLEFYYGEKGKYKERTLPYTYTLYKKIIENKNGIFDNIAPNINYAIQIIKKTSNKEILNKQKEILKITNCITSIPFMPFDIESTMVLPPNILFNNYEEVRKYITTNRNNPFSEFYITKLKDIKNLAPKFIGVSISSSSQIIPGLTLCKILKEETNAHINIGGDYFSRIKNSIPEFKELFSIFTDSISYGEGGEQIVSIAKNISNKKRIHDVDGLIFIDKTLKINKKPQQVNIGKLQIPDYSNYDLDKYLFNSRKLPIQISNCCYWGKCTFCDCCYEKEYTKKTVSSVIKEIKTYIEKYNVYNFDIIDASVHPIFLDKFADALIKNNIKISYTFLARLEKEFTYSLLKKLSKSGAKQIFWGVESFSERILKLINKGIKKDNISKILKNATEVGIENRVFFFIGFPSETKEEAMQTVNYILNNKNIIQSSSMAIFHLGNHSHIAKFPKKYSIEINQKQNNFVPILEYSSKNSLSEEEKIKIFNYYIKNDQHKG